MAFAVIAEERSFTRAASRLGISGSALSHAIRLLEERLGTRLLSRTTRSVAPTVEGQRFLDTLSPALRDIEMGLETLADARDRPSGVVRVNSHRVGALAHVAPKISTLRRNYPDVVLELTIDDTPVDIVAAGFDAGIRDGEALARDMVAVRISPEDRSAVVAAPEYLASAQAINRPEDLMAHPCLLWRFPSSGALLKWEFLQGQRRLHVVVEPTFSTNDMQVLIAAALSGAGPAYVHRDYVAQHLATGMLVELLPDWNVPHEACYIYYPSRRQVRPAMRAVIETLRWRGSIAPEQ
ncbi:LysR family transcriptional regulator [Shinella sp. M31]|uniref:LysR family transcriptional regulator n=1 Tax=Shinella sp. M31 TaxID=3368615 RepID=UPI003B9F6C07